ncbi:protein phosphatase 2C domain-containing protein [Arthrobacter bambusae]|uniref:PP2C family protein-serine/threonine phosphatase n=1 Tax=Arthrobacter bambusae TaxID=1338426 RepID=UPI001F506CB7|nr:protein phosphatase 2C domain-containing protein [Arthrobacter bambusae]MCI0144049.1 protein phosphatase 2C domain-containing protein [Arthrobacter bambusae]
MSEPGAFTHETSDGKKAAQYRIVAVTNRGGVRSQNEDAIGISGWAFSGTEPTALEIAVDGAIPVIVVVADGMGGHRGGATASRLVAESLSKWAPSEPENFNGEIRTAIAHTSRRLLDDGRTRPELAGMGSTVAGVLLRPDGTGIAFNVGDSRVYQFNGGYLGQLSVDDRPPAAPGNNGVMTQCLGGGREVRLDPHLFEFDWSGGDSLLICSDGLHDVIDDVSMEDAFRTGNPAVAYKLVNKTLALGAPDNVSVVTIEWAPVPMTRENDSLIPVAEEHQFSTAPWGSVRTAAMPTTHAVADEERTKEVRQ